VRGPAGTRQTIEDRLQIQTLAQLRREFATTSAGWSTGSTKLAKVQVRRDAA